MHLVKGGDDVLRAEALSRLVDRLVGDGDRGLLLDEFAGPNYELASVVDAAQTLPFLTDRRVVVARHAARFTNADALGPLLGYLGAPAETTDLVVVWERSPEPGARIGAVPPTLTKALKAVGAAVHDAEPPAKGRDAWVGERFAEHGLALDSRARSGIAEQLGDSSGDVVELAQRLLGIFGPGASLTLDDIEPHLGAAGGVPPWELTDAIDRGDTKLALHKLHRMLHGGGRHPLVLLATLHSHYARMLRLDGSAVRGEKEAAALLGLKGSSFPARKALDQATRLGSRGVARAIELLAEADLQLRGAQAWPDELVAEVLVARLTALGRSGRR
ncbi:MAG: DNA polymerase III subunit delta [Actinobacteria bacterium]|nr:DNA polymerase III subunit delta [Actinomycetota bacterium]